LETEESGLLKTLLNYAKGHFGMEQVLLDWNQIAEQYGKLLFFPLSFELDISLFLFFPPFPGEILTV
jgi:hypothetical protein